MAWGSWAAAIVSRIICLYLFPLPCISLWRCSLSLPHSLRNNVPALSGLSRWPLRSRGSAARSGGSRSWRTSAVGPIPAPPYFPAIITACQTQLVDSLAKLASQKKFATWSLAFAQPRPLKLFSRSSRDWREIWIFASPTRCQIYTRTQSTRLEYTRLVHHRI